MFFWMIKSIYTCYTSVTKTYNIMYYSIRSKHLFTFIYYPFRTFESKKTAEHYRIYLLHCCSFNASRFGVQLKRRPLEKSGEFFHSKTIWIQHVRRTALSTGFRKIFRQISIFGPPGKTTIRYTRVRTVQIARHTPVKNSWQTSHARRPGDGRNASREPTSSRDPRFAPFIEHTNRPCCGSAAAKGRRRGRNNESAYYCI